jgi:hypothetical protein
MNKIFAVGNLGKRQVAMRDDGQWFERFRREAPLHGWGAWHKISRRPDHAYYDPRAGLARLPKESIE